MSNYGYGGGRPADIFRILTTRYTSLSKNVSTFISKNEKKFQIHEQYKYTT